MPTSVIGGLGAAQRLAILLYSNKPEKENFQAIIIIRLHGLPFHLGLKREDDLVLASKDLSGTMDAPETCRPGILQVQTKMSLRLSHDFLHRTLIVIIMIYKRRYG